MLWSWNFTRFKLHNEVCVEKGKFLFGALLEGLFHNLGRKYAQKNAHFWGQKFLLLLLLIKKVYTSTLDLSKSKFSLLKKASLKQNIPTKICTN